MEVGAGKSSSWTGFTICKEVQFSQHEMNLFEIVEHFFCMKLRKTTSKDIGLSGTCRDKRMWDTQSLEKKQHTRLFPL